MERPPEIASEETVGTSVLYSADSAAAYLEKTDTPEAVDMEVAQSPLTPPPHTDDSEMPQDELAGDTPTIPLERVVEGALAPTDLSFTLDPQMMELQEFETQLCSTGLYPGGVSEQAIVEHGGQSAVSGPISGYDSGQQCCPLRWHCSSCGCWGLTSHT